jgi:phosphoribosyl 1,2-cyclic phosphodiesterase
VRNVRLNHPGGCTGFIFEKDGRKVIYAPDNELPIEAGEKFPDLMNEGALRKAPQPLLEAFHGADLLILDGQYDDQQYAAKKGWGHSSCFSAVDLAIRAKVKNLAIFHHDPESNDHDVDLKMQACYARVEKHKSNLTVFAAREGVELKF